MNDVQICIIRFESMTIQQSNPKFGVEPQDSAAAAVNK